jgi:predicted glycogen debranching enzyme
MTFDLIKWLNQQSGGQQLPLTLSNLTGLATTPPTQEGREWLVTNGLGSYASGSITGANTRRYHGLLVASLNPPVRRTILFSRLDETLTVGDGAQRYELATNFWQQGDVAPHGYNLLEAFSDLPAPTWCYRVPGGRLIKQIFMKDGEQRAFVGYTWLPDDDKSAANLDLTVLLNMRDFHSETKGADDWHFGQDQADKKSVTIRPFPGAQTLSLQLDRGTYSQDPAWYRNYYWPREHERGLGDHEDCFRSGHAHISLAAGQSVTFVAGLEALAQVPSVKDLATSVSRAKAELIQTAQAPLTNQTLSAPLQRLILAADQFRSHRQSTDGSTIIAGYHWFSDWGRDSMISLPGLCLSTNLPKDGKSILSTFGKYLSQGMLPNYFPDGGQLPEYNTSDATLWWASALYRYYKATGDKEFVKEQLPLLQEVVDWHVKGTRHGLKLDVDGLITGGGPDVQLTWMDAKCGDFVVTPRAGKAVEISALWYNFVQTLDYLRKETGSATADDGSTTGTGSDDATSGTGSNFGQKAKEGFAKFWDEKRGYLADVIHQDGSLDEAIRPNQLFAASLNFPIVSVQQARSIVAVVESKLLTPMGLRTLSPDHPDYQGRYGLGKDSANQYDRDITYHQGTVWPWLLGAWVNARLYAYGHTDENFAFIRDYLKPILAHIEQEACVGSVSEIFDGDAPHKACGCVAQAWSVAELLRVLVEHPQLSAE